MAKRKVLPTAFITSLKTGRLLAIEVPKSPCKARHTHFMHLQVKGVGSNAAHQTLATYYDAIVEATDAVAEVIQGAHDVIITPYPTMFANTTDEPLAYLKKLREYVRTKRALLPQDSEIQNEVDNIANLINRTCYRLERLQ